MGTIDSTNSGGKIMARKAENSTKISNRVASLIVADDILFSIGGKAYLQGVYLNDLSIPAKGILIPQLAVMFSATADGEDQFESVTLEVTLPENEPVRMTMPVQKVPVPEGRRRISYFWPMMLRSIVLNPGKIGAKVIHERGEIDIVSLWITLVPPSAIPKV